MARSDICTRFCSFNWWHARKSLWFFKEKVEKIRRESKNYDIARLNEVRKKITMSIFTCCCQEDKK